MRISLGDVGHVDQGHHQGDDVACLGKAGRYPQPQGAAVLFDIDFFAVCVCQRMAQQAFQFIERHAQLKAGHMLADGGGAQVKAPLRRHIEAHQLAAAVKHQNGKLQGVVQVGVFLRQAHQLGGFDAELAIQADQFFIGGLQFFVGSF